MHEATFVYGVNAALKSARWLMIAAGVLTVHGSDIPLLSADLTCGDPSLGTGRKLVILPGLNHITILTASATHRQILDWLHDGLDAGIWTRRQPRSSSGSGRGADATPDRAAPASSLGDA
jgi:hypothetical protein